MSEKRCYYEVLGVERRAEASEIRKAYKKLALKYHPDRNAGSAEAEAQFKEVTEAFQILNDDDKRQRYDQFGHAGFGGAGDGGGGEDIFSHVQDLFADFFGGMGGGRQARGPQRGRDVRVRQALTLEEAVLGCKKEVQLRTPVECTACKGNGAEPGTEPQACRTCGGNGQVSTGRGFIVFTQTCPSCQGQGRVVTTPCKRCDGAGWEEKARSVTVSFPPGIDDGHRLRVSGQGLAGTSGGPPGHLYVDVVLHTHERFTRDGNDLVLRQKVSFADAALGKTITVELLDGTTREVSIDAGTQPGDVITLGGAGVPDVNGRGRGSLHVVAELVVPTKLSKRARQLLQELEVDLAAHALTSDPADEAR
ncbi:MAG: molecular chaperone DnaJ [Deltaproteobacteria bacterium]|nr:molecular chaperone DnaJ [Deltaproteobacteria bacterium]